MRISTFAVAAAALMMGSGGAWAQANPSADQIINALKHGLERGLLKRENWVLRRTLSQRTPAAGGLVGGSIAMRGLQAAIRRVAAVQSTVLLNWPSGVRARVVVLLTAALVGLAFVDGSRDVYEAGTPWWLPAVYTVLLPVMTVSTLWW